MDHSCQPSGGLLQAPNVTLTKTSRGDLFALKAPTIVGAASTEATDALVLSDGTRLRLRPIDSDDRDGLAALFARLTPESRRRRFLSPKRELTPRELTYLTDIDHVHHEAIAAVDQRDGSIVGVGRYARGADRPRVAEVAVEVADELQSMGIGTALARCTVQRARANGFTLLTATTLSENRPARTLLRRLGFRARPSQGSEIEHELELDPATSKDNVRVILDGYADYNRGDGEPSLDYWHEDAEYLSAPKDPDSAMHRGIDAITRLFASWRDVFPDLRVEVHEAKANRNQVFVWVRFVGRGAASGIPIHMELAHVCTMRRGKTARLVEYTDRTEALEAVGLIQ
jgi:ketosteroid isomerase-like protein/RimJ/RimL family protein N-acetyltransferase